MAADLALFDCGDCPFAGGCRGHCAHSRVHNVHDRRHGWVGSWEVEPLDYSKITKADIGRTVIYQKAGLFWGAEAGTLSSYRDGRVWARFTQGITAAACDPSDLTFGKAPLDGDLSR